MRATRAWTIHETERGYFIESLFYKRGIWTGPMVHYNDPPLILPTMSPMSVTKVSPFTSWVMASERNKDITLDSTSGIWAFTSYDAFVAWAKDELMLNTMRAIGEIEVAGKVVVHERGVRAEKACVRSLTIIGVPIVVHMLPLAEARNWLNKMYESERGKRDLMAYVYQNAATILEEQSRGLDPASMVTLYKRCDQELHRRLCQELGHRYQCPVSYVPIENRNLLTFVDITTLPPAQQVC